MNFWIIVSVDDDASSFLNTVTNHQVTLAPDSIREFREPDLVILRGQIFLHDEGRVTFEPFASGLVQGQNVSALAESLNSDEVKELLGAAMNLGHNIVASDRAYLVDDWIRFIRDFIAASLGGAESTLFMNSSGYVFYSGSGNTKNVMEGRLRRLSELLPRVNNLRINEGLNLQEWKDRFQTISGRL